MIRQVTVSVTGDWHLTHSGVSFLRNQFWIQIKRWYLQTNSVVVVVSMQVLILWSPLFQIEKKTFIKEKSGEQWKGERERISQSESRVVLALANYSSLCACTLVPPSRSFPANQWPLIWLLIFFSLLTGAKSCNRNHCASAQIFAFYTRDPRTLGRVKGLGPPQIINHYISRTGARCLGVKLDYGQATHTQGVNA